MNFTRLIIIPCSFKIAFRTFLVGKRLHSHDFAEMRLHAVALSVLVLNLRSKCVLSECFDLQQHGSPLPVRSHLNFRSDRRILSTTSCYALSRRRNAAYWMLLSGGATAPSPQAADGFDLDDAIAAMQSVRSASKKLWTQHFKPLYKRHVLPVLRGIESHVVEPLQDLLYNHTLEAHQRRRSCFYQTSTWTAVGTGVAVATWPRRLLRVSLLAWLLAESMAFIDTLSNDKFQKSLDTLLRKLRSQIERRQIDVEWKEVRKKWNKVRMWWRSVQRHPAKLWITLDNHVALRYQWTLGAATGLFIAPPVRAILYPMAKVGIYAFLLGETNRLLRGNQRGEWADLSKDPGDVSLMNRLEETLEVWCHVVESAIEHPTQAFESARVQVHATMRTDWKMPQSVEYGLLVGLVLGLIGGL